MVDDIRKKIIMQVAANLGSSIREVDQIVASQSAYAKKVMESNSFEGIAFPYLGKFIASPRKLRKVNMRAAFKRGMEVWDYSRKKISQ